MRLFKKSYLKGIYIICISFSFYTLSFAQKQDIRSVKTFSKMDVNDRIVAILKADTISKVILVPEQDAWLEEVHTKSDGKQLSLSTEGKFRDSKVFCYVHHNQNITYIDVQNGGIIRTDTNEVYESNKLEINAKLDGFTNMDVNVTDLIIHAGSGCDLYIKGYAKNVQVYATTGAKVHFEDLVCDNADATSILGAKVWLTATNDYKAKAGSGGKIYYHTEPLGKFDRNRTTGGNIELYTR